MSRALLLIVFIIHSFDFSSSNFKKRNVLKNNNEKLKILTWNVQMLPRVGSIFSSSLRKLQNERTDWIVEHLIEQDCDIVLLQESFDYSFIEKINSTLINIYPYQMNPYKPSIFKLSNGLMILSKYPIEVKDKITFKGSAQSDIFASKGAVLTKVYFNEDSIFLLNTHLQADYGLDKYCSIRTNQLKDIQYRMIKKHFSSSYEEEKIILAGDLNIEENRDSDEYQNLISRLKLVDIVHHFFKKPSISFDNKNYWNKDYKSSYRLDYFLTNFLVRDLNIKIQTPKKLLNKQWVDLADHYGISAEFCLN